jgi:hypothetical protein
MKMKTVSLLVKIALVVAGFGLSVLKWCGILPDADVGEIWKSCAFAYGVSMGTIDFNICRDNWVESKGESNE